MKWWQTTWELMRDIGFNGLGAYAIYSQIGTPSPSQWVILGGLALIYPAVRHAITNVLSAPSPPEPGHGESSPPAPSSSPSPSLPPSAAAHEEAGHGKG